jgi:CheY-like chemotaxis protein
LTIPHAEVYSSMALILVVDDDPAIRRMMRMRFERSGDGVIEAADAMAALDMLRQGAVPDAVVSDVMMPGMSGLQFYRELVVEQPRLRHRVVFLTAANDEPSVHKPIEDLEVPLLGKLDDLQLVVDAVRIAVLRAHD